MYEHQHINGRRKDDVHCTYRTYYYRGLGVKRQGGTAQRLMFVKNNFYFNFSSFFFIPCIISLLLLLLFLNKQRGKLCFEKENGK